MKKFFLSVLFVSCLSLSGNYSTTAAVVISANTEIKVINDVLYVEYIQLDNNWFEYTYYTDGSIGIRPVQKPPQE